MENFHKVLCIYTRSVTQLVCKFEWLTLWCGECQLVFVSWSLRQPVTIAEHIRMKLLELNRGGPNSFHPGPISDILCNEGGPDGNRFERTTARCGFEADTARVYISKYAESMKIVPVSDLTSLMSV
jgi:hypothetical protein